MNTSNTLWKVVLISALVLIGIGSLVYTQVLVERIRKKERISVELWAKAIQYNSSSHNVDVRQELLSLMKELEDAPLLSSTQKRRWNRIIQRAESDLANAALDFVATELIIEDRFEIPSIVVDSTGTILYSRYLEEEQLTPELIEQFKRANSPIYIEIGEPGSLQRQTVYFGESATIALLRYYPIGQFVLLTVFMSLAYYSWSNIRKREQSNLWVGMAKEAAHQLGTPLSSLMGWLELIKSDDSLSESNRLYVRELENDVSRLERVADRFSKIGSTPELVAHDLDTILHDAVTYIRKRLPTLGHHVQVNCESQTAAKVNINPQLFDWAIENLLKNAIDAIDVTTTQKGSIAVKSILEDHRVVIEIEDNGKGIEKKNHEDIFKPGFSTKKRGWGLGLSLTRRIIEEYHKGKIFVKDSLPGKGTIMRIELPLG